MAIRFRCIHCQRLLSIATRKAGQVVKCPACGGELHVPRELGDEPSPAAAAPAAPPVGDEEAAGEQGRQESLPYAGRSVDFNPREAVAEPPSPMAGASAEIEESAALSRGDLSPNYAAQVAPPEDDEDAFALRSPDTAFDEMDLTPMVDVTFLLLIFFMITASFSLQKTIQVPAPNPDEKGAQALTLEDLESDSIIILIDEKNAIFVDDEPVSDPGSLTDLLQDKIRSDQKAELVVEADERSLHETVVLVIDAANGAGMQKIRLASRAGDD